MWGASSAAGPLYNVPPYSSIYTETSAFNCDKAPPTIASLSFVICPCRFWVCWICSSMVVSWCSPYNVESSFLILIKKRKRRINVCSFSILLEGVNFLINILYRPYYKFIYLEYNGWKIIIKMRLVAIK